jgi:hypothetical protein
MKKTAHVAVAGLCILFTLAGCINAEEPVPMLDSSELRSAVQGRWGIEGISNKLCREANCNTTNYIGTTKDFIEFRADSVFVTRGGIDNVLLNEKYRADYTLRGAIILSTNTWSAKFIVEEINAKRLVLKSKFTGRDPAAVFTDTYYLKK